MTTEAVPIVIDLGDVATRLRRRVLVVLAWLALGALAAVGILFVATPRFDGEALMLIRTAANDPTSLIKDRMGALSELMPTSLGLGGGAEDQLATELALLQSRAVL